MEMTTNEGKPMYLKRIGVHPEYNVLESISLTFNVSEQWLVLEVNRCRKDKRRQEAGRSK
jgi:hypothetical protein